MNPRVPKDIEASVRSRLLNIARAQCQDFQLVLTRYVNERLRYRLATSEHADRFVLEGAALFTLWTGAPHRATRDLDLLGFGDPSQDRILEVFAEILRQDVPDDGVTFDLESLVARPIRKDQIYGGIRLELAANVTTARVRVQIDVGFGDAITPSALECVFPTVLDAPAPRLRVYPRETVVAEKFEAMVQLGLANTRLKDFYDLHVLTRTFDFEARPVIEAVKATFQRRQTQIPRGLPTSLTPAFLLDPGKQTQWGAFLRKAGVRGGDSLPYVGRALGGFFEPALLALAAGSEFDRLWIAGRGWVDNGSVGGGAAPTPRRSPPPSG